MTDDKKAAAFAERQQVIFKLGQEEFGVDINQVREIIKLEDITKIPNTQDYISGVINLRGKIITVIDLAKKLNLPMTTHNKDTRIIVIEVSHNTIGMIVDTCNEVIHIMGNQIEAAPDIIKQKISADFIEGVAILKERLIILLNLGKVIGEDELTKIMQQ